jgi:hypothetical protein
MSNPWLGVPLEDYEGHMDSPEVHQLSALSELFAEALALCRPESVAVLGIAGGNGLHHVDRAITKRIVGLDVNPSYLEVVRSRYAHTCLELHCVDLAAHRIDVEPVQMVHAALVFEHAGVDLCLENALSLVAPGGALSVVLQLPTEIGQNVSASRFPSMQTLRSDFSLIDPIWLRRTLEQRDFRLTHETQRSLPAGKGFWMGVFRQSDETTGGSC